MPLYQSVEHFSQMDSPEFDKLYKPGERTAWSGIYRCENCGYEAVHTLDKPLPPQNHHVHKPSVGPILWRLLVTDSAQF